MADERVFSPLKIFPTSAGERQSFPSVTERCVGTGSAKGGSMNLERNLGSVRGAAAVVCLLAAGRPALVAADSFSPALAAPARITALAGKLFDRAGKALTVGSVVVAGDRVRTAPGQTARLMLGRAGTSSSIICIEPGSEVAFLWLSPSTDTDYPLLDAEISLRNVRVRANARRIF